MAKPLTQKQLKAQLKKAQAMLEEKETQLASLEQSYAALTGKPSPLTDKVTGPSKLAAAESGAIGAAQMASRMPVQVPEGSTAARLATEAQEVLTARDAALADPLLDPFYKRGVGGLSPAQLEARQALLEAQKGMSAVGLTSAISTSKGSAGQIETPPETGLKPGYEWYASKQIGGGVEWKQRRISGFTTPVVSGSVVSGGSSGGTAVKSETDSDKLLAQMKAEADAAKLATKQKASDKLTAIFAAYGLESLAPFINTRIMADVSEEMLLLELYDQPEYQKRFPGMKALRAKGKAITEKEYSADEKAMMQTARFFDLPKGFYDGPEDFGALIGNLVSPKEYQDRLQIGQDLSRTLNPSVKQQLIDFYGIGEGDLTAFVLDADKALPLIQKQAKAAQFVGIGRAAGFELRGITSGQAENIAGTESYAKLSERELAQALGQAGQLRRTQKRLSGIEGQDYSEQEALSAVMEGSPQALLASQQRAQREGARFGARGGVTGASLRSTATPI